MMKTTNHVKESIIGILAFSPLLYYIYLWNSLPAEIPVHFDAQGKPNNYGSRTYMGITLLCLSMGIYLLLLFIPKIDPKKNFSIFSKTYQKLRIILSAFFCCLSFILIFSVKNSQLNTSVFGIVFGLLFALMGNYLSNVRPNYFFGIRTPWALKSESNWKKTHFFAGRLWFFSGLLLFAMTLIFPDIVNKFLPIGIIIVISLIPIIYSYIIYKKDDGKVNNNNNNDGNYQPKKSSANNSFRSDDSNWTGYIFYNNKYDKRIFVPKRIGFGYTINLGNPYTYLLIVVFIALSVLFSKLV